MGNSKSISPQTKRLRQLTAENWALLITSRIKDEPTRILASAIIWWDWFADRLPEAPIEKWTSKIMDHEILDYGSSKKGVENLRKGLLAIGFEETYVKKKLDKNTFYEPKTNKRIGSKY